MLKNDMIKTSKFRKGLRFICIFCFGKNCKNENYLKNKINDIKGLNCNWITDDILASQRPSTRINKEFGIPKKFKEVGIKAIICLQEPGEHPFCGDGIHNESGLSYLPEEFNKEEIVFYNYCWRDHQTAGLDYIIKIINQIEQYIIKKQKIMIHCHAGKGRTGLIICCLLIKTKNIPATEAIKLFKSKRSGALKVNDQIKTIKNFEKYLIIQTKNIFYINWNLLISYLKQEQINELKKLNLKYNKLYLTKSLRTIENEISNIYERYIFNNSIPLFLELIFKLLVKKMDFTLEDFINPNLNNEEEYNLIKIKIEMNKSKDFNLLNKLNSKSLIIIMIEFFINLDEDVFNHSFIDSMNNLLCGIDLNIKNINIKRDLFNLLIKFIEFYRGLWVLEVFKDNDLQSLINFFSHLLLKSHLNFNNSYNIRKYTLSNNLEDEDFRILNKIIYILIDYDYEKISIHDLIKIRKINYYKKIEEDILNEFNECDDKLLFINELENL